MGQSQVLFDYRFNIAWRNCMEIENVSDLDLNRLRKRIIEIILVHTEI